MLRPKAIRHLLGTVITPRRVRFPPRLARPLPRMDTPMTMTMPTREELAKSFIPVSCTAFAVSPWSLPTRVLLQGLYRSVSCAFYTPMMYASFRLALLCVWARMLLHCVRYIYIQNTLNWTETKLFSHYMYSILTSSSLSFSFQPQLQSPDRKGLECLVGCLSSNCCCRVRRNLQILQVGRVPRL